MQFQIYRALLLQVLSVNLFDFIEWWKYKNARVLQNENGQMLGFYYTPEKMGMKASPSC